MATALPNFLGNMTRHHRRALLCALPAVIFLSCFFVLPLAIVAILSVSDGSFGFRNYGYLVSSPVYVLTIVSTTEIALYVVLICLVVGYPLAYCMSRMSGRGASVALALLILPWWTSILVRSYAWVVILSPIGLINSTLLKLGFIESPLALLYNKVGVVIGTAHVLIPFAVLPIYAVMKRFDARWILAAESLGANPVRVFIHVFLPLTLPGVIAAGTLIFIQALGFFITPALLGGGRVPVVSTLIETQVVDLLNWGLASGLGVLLLILTVIAIVVSQKLLGHQLGMIEK
jgi:putative spermidine/putrescine transport system permease protein